MEQKKIGIIGVGAIGTVLAAKLGHAGHEVYVVDTRKDIVDAVNDSGVHLNGIMELNARVTKALTSIDQFKELDLDHIFVCTKAYVLPRIVNDLSMLDTGTTSFVCFQNGLDLMELLQSCLDSRCIFRVAVNYAGMVTTPGHVDVTFFHKPNFLGCLDCAEAETIERAKEIASLLSDSGLETEYAPDIQKRVWQKVILNSALMLTSVLTRLPMNQIMGIPETREVIESHLDECLEVARAEGYEFGDDFRNKALQYLANAGAHKTSMLIDFEIGNPIEVDYLNAKIQEHAEKYGLACRQNKLMIALVKGLLHHRNSCKEKR
jgi:2-dehydropantoate 2-reductase